jgi:acyl-CoA synthetase (AMP-forming)/AMP-acid ligase II
LVISFFDKELYEKGIIKELEELKSTKENSLEVVSVGTIISNTEVVIVDNKNKNENNELGDDRIGEIFVCGDGLLFFIKLKIL